MITYQEYSTCSLSQKADYLYTKGIFLTFRFTRSHLIELYALEDFFVEIWMSNGHINNDQIILKIKALSGKEVLKPYLREISIDDLFQI